MVEISLSYNHRNDCPNISNSSTHPPTHPPTHLPHQTNSYTMVEIPLSWNHRNDCPNIGNSGFSTGGAADWIELKNVPGTVRLPTHPL